MTQLIILVIDLLLSTVALLFVIILMRRLSPTAITHRKLEFGRVMPSGGRPSSLSGDDAEFAKEVQANIRRQARDACIQEINKLGRRSLVARRGAWIFVVLGFLAGIAGFASLYWCGKTPWYDLGNLGTYGSFLQGAVSSMWSLSALLFVYAAFLGQQMDFYNQGSEMQDQKEQFELQHESIKRQSFESSFFELLSFQNAITTQLIVLEENATGVETMTLAQGRACFGQWYAELANTCAAGKPGISQEDSIRLTQEHCELFFDKHQAALGHYVRTLYHLVKFVDNSGLRNSEKRGYTSLVRAQISTCELLLVFYSCFCPYGVKFKPLIEKFGLFEHLDKYRLIDTRHTEFFVPSAYV